MENVLSFFLAFKKSKYFDTTRDRELDGRKNLQDDYLKQFGIVAALPLKEFIRKRNVMIQNAKEILY